MQLSDAKQARRWLQLMAHRRWRRAPIFALLIAIPGTQAIAASPSHDDPMTGEPRADGIDIRSGTMLMRVTALTEDILRIRVARDGNLPEDASWAVASEMRAAQVSVTAMPEDTMGVAFRTTSLVVRVQRDPMRLVILDRAGRVLSSDAMTQPIAMRGHAFEVRKSLPEDERIFAMGDKTGPLDRRSGAFVDWNTDVGRFTQATDPLYKSIPFFIGTAGDGRSYGLLLDNTWRTWFDFGKRDAQVLSFGADDGPIDYYFVNGPSIARVVERYTDLTGKPPLPPLWSLGYQQSRYSYMSADELRSIARRLRSERLPTDVLWLDIDYQDRNRPFTTNAKTYPDLRALATDMAGDGFRLVAITDLHIAQAPGQGYVPYDSGVAGDHFVKSPDGKAFVGQVWPGASVFPDFTRAATRAWWGGLYKDFVGGGIAGFWNDMNEPALFMTHSRTMPLDVVHRIDTPGFVARNATHSEIHNVYGMENTRATFEGQQALRPDERPFVMTRASYAGGQRYAVTWTGDNSSTWSHLKLAVSQLLSLGLSGFAYSGADVGGFTGGPSPELLTRWFEVAAFTPVFRDHSANDAPRQEPWLDGPKHTDIRRRFIETRYRLMPYLYALADENARTGAPLMRPVFYNYPDALDAPCDQSMSFLLGARLLIAAPPTPESPRDYKVCLPAGGWYDFWTGLAISDAAISDVAKTDTTTNAGNVHTLVETPRLDRLPVYVRAGTLLPRQPLVQSTAQTPQGSLSIDVYPGDDCRGVLYADDGHSMAYRARGFLRQQMHCRVGSDGIHLGFDARAGDYTPWWTTIEVIVHGWQGAGHVVSDGADVATHGDAATQTLRFSIADQRQATEISIAHVR